MSQAQEHLTVMLHEAVDALAVKPQGAYVDGTFGRGGHSRLILSQLVKTDNCGCLIKIRVRLLQREN